MFKNKNLPVVFIRFSKIQERMSETRWKFHGEIGLSESLQQSTTPDRFQSPLKLADLFDPSRLGCFASSLQRGKPFS